MISKIDGQILSYLEQDSRISFADLAEAVGLSKTPCWNRVKKLEQQGIIKGHTTILDSHKLGLQISAMLHVVVDFAQYQEFELAVKANPSIVRCAAVTGDFDYVLEVLSTDMQSFDHLLRYELSRLPGVNRFSTSIATREVKDTGKKLSLLLRT
ncbi:Lrp/AsnC family transcriptional regulator [Glaciecola sp. 1036]|uniref:Lrp/AsnC family transcriptional regulator n=1 Tax=Alteromonadaceae TaxID=72275 RepID=UPI003D010714